MKNDPSIIIRITIPMLEAPLQINATGKFAIAITSGSLVAIGAMITIMHLL